MNNDERRTTNSSAADHRFEDSISDKSSKPDFSRRDFTYKTSAPQPPLPRESEFTSHFDFKQFSRNSKEGDAERGVVICVPIRFRGNDIEMKSRFSPLEIRSSLLFFDRLVWPRYDRFSMIANEGTEAKILEDSGIIIRPEMRYLGGQSSPRTVAEAHIAAFQRLDEASPGNWALATGEESFQWDELKAGPADGAFIHLLRAIPIPDYQVPLVEVLEFRERRKDEARNLRHEIDLLSELIRNSEFPNAELAARQKYIEAACADLLKAGMSWKFPIRIADFKCGVELDLKQVAQGLAVGWATDVFELPTISAIIGGALSMVKITADIKRQKILPRATPYQYVYNFHQDLF